MLAFLKCVAAAVVEKGFSGLAEMIPGGKFAYDVAEAAWKKYREQKKEAEARAEVQQLAAATFDEARQAAVEAVREAVAGHPAVSDSDKTILEQYLTQIPATVRRTLKRAEDPTGTTVPSTFSLDSPDDLAELLPARPPRFAPGQPLPGKPGWSLVELLGVGGFGEVWLARHSRMASLTGAVKFCHGEAARDLLHESALIDRVMAVGKHPNIVSLLDVNLDGDAPWVMFEYVSGGDLADAIRGWQGLTTERRIDRAISTLGELADAVGHFHGLMPPVVHRDLKPSNILCEQGTGKLRITDFGIGAVAAHAAFSDEASAAATRGGRLLSYLRGSHTPLYSSPQQRAGANPDPRDDVHALGVITYQMLTGDLARGVGADFSDDLRDAGASEELIALIGRCVAQKAERRPSDGVELRKRLQDLRAAKPPVSPSAPAPPQMVTYSGEKRPGVLAAIVRALEEASEERPITKEAVLESLKKQFPDRDPNGMRSTVNTQMSSQLRSERRIVLASRATESGTGYWIDAEATAKLQAGGTPGTPGGRDIFGARPGTRTHAIHAVLLAATEPLTAKEVSERSKTNATYQHLRTMLQKGWLKKTVDGRYQLAPREEWTGVTPAEGAEDSESFRVWLVRTLREQGRTDAAEAAERLFGRADANNYHESGNRTASPGGSLRFAVQHEGRSHEVFAVGGKGEVQLPLQYMTFGPFGHEQLRREYLDRVGRIPGVAERCERWDNLTGWPCFPLEVIHEQIAFDQFLEAVEWAADVIRGTQK